MSLIIKVLLLMMSVVSSLEETNDDIEKFVATSEWATVREGNYVI